MAGNHRRLVRMSSIVSTISETHLFNKAELIFLNTSDIYLGEILHQTYSKVASMPGQAKKTIREGDILLSEIRPANGRWAMVGKDAEDYVVSTKLMVLRPNLDRVHPDFLYIFLTSKETTRKLQHVAEYRSATFPQITFDQVSELELNLPSMSEQKSIVGIIKSIDKKIKANSKHASILEEIAQTIFKSWFIDFDPVKAKMAGEKPVGMDDATAALFPDSMEDSELGPIPKGWNVKSLDAIASQRKENVGIDDLSEDDVYVGLDSIPRKSLFFNEWESAAGVQSGKTRFHSHDILFGKLRPYFHKVSIAPVNGVCSTDVVVIYVERVELLPYVACLVNQSTFVDFLSHRSTGTRMPRTSWKEMCEFRIACPPDVVLKEFGKFMLGSFEQGIKLQLQIRTLIELRDSLLPRLISGELQIPEEMLAS